MFRMFTSSTAAVTSILLFIFCEQLMVTIGSAVETKELNGKSIMQERTDISGYNVYPLGKSWTYDGNDPQCTVIWTGSKRLTLDDCIKICDNEDSCTAFLTNMFEGNQYCSLFLDCPSPFPEPKSTSRDSIGYSKKPMDAALTGYNVYPLGKSWTYDGNDPQCTALGTGNKDSTLDDCIKICDNEDSCTAFLTKMFKGNQYCWLFLDCPSPIPEPKSTSRNFIGYSKKPMDADCEFQDAFKDTCAVLECDRQTGNYIFMGYDEKCPTCSAFLDPHILSFDKGKCGEDSSVRNCHASYRYMGIGNYTLTQFGVDHNPNTAVYSTFVPCGGSSDYSCVGSVTLKNEDIVITVGLDDDDVMKIQLNGENVDYGTLSTSPSFIGSNNINSVLAWTSEYSNSKITKCVTLQGSSGITVRYCGDPWNKANAAFVWAHPSVTKDLKGLCGTANNDFSDDFTTRDGNVLTFNYVAPEEFASSWQTSNSDEPRSSFRSERQTQNRCETNASVEEEFRIKCSDSASSSLPNAELDLVKSLVDSCVYDLCNVIDPDQWMNSMEVYLQVENETLGRTFATTINPNITWISIGSDRFARFPQPMNWTAARTLCQSYGLDLYQPKNITAVAIYLENKFSDRWYWIGARGNGTSQIWLSGGTVPRSAPWFSNYYLQVSTDQCMEIVTHSGYAAKKQTLAPVHCGSTHPAIICG